MSSLGRLGSLALAAPASQLAAPRRARRSVRCPGLASLWTRPAAARHRHVLHDLRSQSAGGGGRPGAAAGRRQRGRRRHRRATGAEPGRAAVLGHRRRRVRAALAGRRRAAEDLRRARDGPCRRQARPLPCGRRPAQACPSHLRRRQRRRSRHDAAPGGPAQGARTPPLGAAVRAGDRAGRAGLSASLRAFTCCCDGRAPRASPRGRAAISSIGPAMRGPSATS